MSKSTSFYNLKISLSPSVLVWPSVVDVFAMFDQMVRRYADYLDYLCWGGQLDNAMMIGNRKPVGDAVQDPDR